jgi:hypothetical protein
MSSDMKCTFCRKSLLLGSYVDHITNYCDKLLPVEKNQAQEAINKLLCECRVCNNYIYVKRYEQHREDRHPYTNEPQSLIEPQLSCFCPFIPGTSISGDMPFNKYKNHALKECAGYINFIAGHCQPPADWPHAEIEKLKYWLRLLETCSKSRCISEGTEGEDSGPSIWVTFVSGGLCNGR